MNSSNEKATRRILCLTEDVYARCGKCDKSRIAIVIGSGCLSKLADDELIDYFEAAMWLWYGQFVDKLQVYEPDSGFALLQLLLPVGEFLGYVRKKKSGEDAYTSGLKYVFQKHKTATVTRLAKTLWGDLRGNMAHQLLKARHVRLDTQLNESYEIRQGVQGYDAQAWVATIDPTSFTQCHLAALERFITDLRKTSVSSTQYQFRKYMTKGGTACLNP